ncbi:MAG: hypothetical protein ACMUIS_08210 [bacterium]
MKGKGFKGHDNTTIIHIEDLVPIDDVRGGSGRILFGERGDLSRTSLLSRAQRGMGIVSCRHPGFMYILAAGWRWCLRRVIMRRGGRRSENKR